MLNKETIGITPSYENKDTPPKDYLNIDLVKAVPRIASKKVTRHILEVFKLKASKRLGQNFLIDNTVVEDIVKASELTADEIVLEIGPGIGTLTQALAETGAAVIAVELDKKLPAVLKETLKPYKNVTIIPGDILKVDIERIIKEVSGKCNPSFKVIANLPYYITTPIIMALLERRLNIERIVVMVQKEVAIRMTARANAPEYGSLSVATQYYTEPKIIMDVKGDSFIPRPEVTSSVIVCKVLPAPRVSPLDEKIFFRVVRAAFMQRRKTLLNSLKGAGFMKDEILEALTKVQIDSNRRGETLTIKEFQLIADALLTTVELRLEE